MAPSGSAESSRGYRVWVEAWRQRRVESRHRVVVAGVGTPALPAYERDPDSLPRTSMRSTAKPFQLLPLIAAGGAERFQLDAADLALMAASHDGTEADAARAAAILARLGLGAEDLRCGLQRPYFLERLPPDDPARARLYGPLHHNCSGNHAGFLALALLHGVPTARYLDAASPSQTRAHGVVEALAGARPDVLEDDCGAPCYDLPLAAIGRCYRFLARPDAVHGLEPERRERLQSVVELPAVVGALERIAAAMTQFPECVASAHTGLWRLAREFPGELVVKNGAEGMLCVAWRDRGAALALKVVDGHPRAALPALLFLMQEFGWLPATAAARLREQCEPVRRGTRGQEIGQLRVCRAP